MKRLNEQNYTYKHPFGAVVVPDVEVGVAANGRKSLAANEITRLTRLAALEFLRRHYRLSLSDPDFNLSTPVVRAMVVFLGVNQTEFALLIGCQKAKVSKVLKGEQTMSKSQAILAMERLAMELARPGSVRRLLGDHTTTLSEPDPTIVRELNSLRFADAA